MLEKETADLITFILIAGVGIELIAILAFGIWRRLYLQRFSHTSRQTRSHPAVGMSHHAQSGSLRDTTAAPMHQSKASSLRDQSDKKQ